MILRLGANAAAHAAGGFVLGVTGVFAACTAAQAAGHVLRNGGPPRRLGDSGLDDALSSQQSYAPQPPPSPRT